MWKRACDPCAARKAKCDRHSPCQRCRAHNLSCTTVRVSAKPGPKGPWSNRRKARTQTQKGSPGVEPVKFQAASTRRSDIGSPASETRPGSSNNLIARDELLQYLYIYQQESYTLWPVIDVERMSSRLLNTADVSAYALCTAISAVILQRTAQHRIPDIVQSYPGIIEHSRLAAESKRARTSLLYSPRPDPDILLSSFFLHIYSANAGQICEATLLLREAITVAQLLQLDQGTHYANLPMEEAQLHLRIAWLLHITERCVTKPDF